MAPQPKLLAGYRKGDDLDFYYRNKSQAVWSIVMQFIKEDLGGNPTPAECEEELRRLCEPSVRHYCDCTCPICR